MAKIPPAISSRMPAVNSRRADNCSILGIPLCAKIVLHPVDVPGTNCNVPQGLSHCSGRHWCIQRHQKQCRPHLVGNIVFRHTTAFFLLPSSGRMLLHIQFNASSEIFTFNADIVSTFRECNCITICSGCFKQSDFFISSRNPKYFCSSIRNLQRAVNRQILTRFTLYGSSAEQILCI